MIKIAFDPKAKEELYKAHQNHPNPRIRKKLMAVYMKSLDIEHETIRETCRVSWPTLLSYFKEYTCGGIDELTKNRYRGHPSELNKFRDEIQSLLVKTPPATVKEAKAKIKELTGITRSDPQIWFFMRKLGLSTRKVCGIPGKADPEVQEAFKKTSLSRDLQKHKQGKELCIL